MPSVDGPGRELFAGRYRLRTTIKTANGVRTALATDTAAGGLVVLKIFERSSVHDVTQLRFLHETRVLQELSAVGLCDLRDAGQTEQHLFSAQLWVPGRDLRAVLTTGPLAVRTALRLGIDLARALEAAHDAGVHHRDIKPANVIVDGRAPDGTFDAVTLIDFGLAHSPWLDASIHDELVGTIRYLSPESAGLVSAPVDERADLYSLGIVLFECLAGRPPFEGPGVGDLLRQHLSQPVPDVRSLAPSTPRALDTAVQRLLRKDPAERYQSAGAVAADLAEILTALDAGDADPAVVIGRHDRRLTLTDPAFVGRDAELAALADLVRRPGAASGLVLMEADSGGGKSRLLAEVAQLAREDGTLVLTGQGVALSGQRPFTVLHGVAEDIAALVERGDLDGPALAEQVREVAPSIVRALPALAGVLGASADQDTGPEQFGELRGLAGLVRLLGALGAPEQRVLVVLDDCQWADTLTVRLLADMYATPDRIPQHLSIIAAFRSEEVPGTHPLRQIPVSRSVHLGPLGPIAIGRLAESMAGPLPRPAVDIVVRLAEGNPFMAAAVLRGLVEAGVVLSGPDGWTVDEARLPEVQAARRSAAFLVRRLELLDDDALRFLSVGAILGKQFDVRTALAIADRVDGGRILEDASRRRLLWLDADGVVATFFHDKIRESLLDRLDGDLRADLHGRAADALVHAGIDTEHDGVFDLAYHLHAAGRFAAALEPALTAATVARNRYALDSAATYYRIAAECVDPADAPKRLAIADGYGDVLMLQGVYAAARQRFTEARARAVESAQAAALEGKLGQLAFKQGEIPEAKAHLEGALRLLGRRPPNRATYLPHLLRELVVQVLHSLFPRLTRRRPRAGHEDDFLAMRVYSHLAYLHWFHSGKIRCAWAHLREMNLAERYEPTAELGQAWSEHAPVMTMLPWYRRAIRYAERSLEVRRALGDVWGQGQSLNFTGVARYAASDLPGAQQALEEAIRVLRRTGDRWEANTARWTLAACLLRRGELARAAELARDTFESASAINDQTAAGIALSLWTRATGAAVDPALVRRTLADITGDAQTTAELQLADGLLHRRAGDLAAAAEALAAAARTVREAGLRQEYVAPVFPWQATILRELAETTPRYDTAARQARLRAAAAAVRRARRWARAYRNNQPHALREAGLLAALRGRHRTAARLLARSAATAESIGMPYDAALTALAVAEVSGADAERVRQAQASVDAFLLGARVEEDVTAPVLSTLDRFSTLLGVGRSIAAATTQRALERAVREGTLALLRAERFHLLPVSVLSGDELVTESGAPVQGVSRTLLQSAVEQRRPVVALDDASDSADSLVLSGIRSALAVPVLVHGEARSCIYVTHGQLGELFGDAETAMASFVATLAGAAYEHLLGSETRFRSLVQSSSDVITLVDADGVITYQSSSLQRVFGLPPTRTVGRPVTHWVHPDDQERLLDALAAARSGDDVRVEYRAIHADGSYRSVESTVSDLLEEPTVAGLVLNTRDVTDRAAAAEELRLKNIELEKASRTKDTFLASMSHDLRTPLNGILGFTGTLLMQLPGPLNPEQARQLRIVERSGKHLLAIINDLLDMTKIESGRVQLVLDDVDCGRLLAEISASVRPLADEKGLSLTLTVPDGVVLLRSDRRALGQILINLIGNAIKFTDVGGVEVALHDDPATGRSRVTVRDTGPGIAGDDLERIFDAFERGAAQRRTTREGTGLGLHISRKLAQLLGARISVQSEVGVGTTFAIDFADVEEPAVLATAGTAG